MELDAYREARLRARALRGRLSRRSVLEINQSLRTYINELERLLKARFPDEAIRSGQLAQILEETIRINELTARRLMGALIDAISEGRLVTFEEVLSVWRAAGRDAAIALGGEGLIGAVRAAPVSMLGVYSSSNAASSWQTLIGGHAANAAGEANAIVRGALLEGVGADELSRRLRRYVVGSEPFGALFESVPTLSGEVAKIDLSTIPSHLRGAAREMEYNARRIAVTEIGHARREGEIQHGMEDPLIIGWRWRLSPNRGPEARIPDACDMLAEENWFDMGPGVFPYDKAPTEPHPNGRCELESIARAISEINEAKRSADRVLRVDDMKIPGEDELTEARVAQIREQTRAAVRFGEEALERALAA